MIIYGDDSDDHAICPDCGGRGWVVQYTFNGDPPEQLQCDRCWGAGRVEEHTLTEAERVTAAYQAEALLWDTTLGDGLDDEEQDDPLGLLDDSDATDEEPSAASVSS